MSVHDSFYILVFLLSLPVLSLGVCLEFMAPPCYSNYWVFYLRLDLTTQNITTTIRTT